MIDGLNLAKVPSPCFAIDTAALVGNLELLRDVRHRSGAKILLALKGFAAHALFPIVREYLDGTCASGLWEARLGRETFGKEVHTYSPAYSDEEAPDIFRLSDHVIFNSFSQLARFRPLAAEHPNVHVGLRVNPERSEAPVALYDPCGPKSRLGVRRDQFEGQSLDGVSGLHFHVLCEQEADALERVAAAFETKFGEFLPAMKWVNFGGGHHITKPGYDIDRLCGFLRAFRERYEVDAILEPGEAVALNAGVLIATVLDIIENGANIAILDISAACHTPDVLEMPYRPNVIGAGKPGEKPHAYRLAGVSCLAGDVIGDYAFERPLKVGDKVVFLDMAHYSMVKTTMFNGVKHPAIAAWDAKRQQLDIIKRFDYHDYRDRLS